MVNRSQRFFFRVRRGGLLVVCLALLTYLLYFHRLGSLLPGYSATELRAYSHALSWHAIATDPINAPYTALVWLLAAVLHHGIISTRLAAASFGVVAILVFYVVVRPWYDFWLALLATLLFATSAGFLHTARLGNGSILQMTVLGLFAVILWYRRTHTHQVASGYLATIVLALLWYIPGIIWFEWLAIGLLWKGMRRQFQQTAVMHRAGWVVLFLVLITPLAWAVARTPQLALTVLGLPHQLVALDHFGNNLLSAILSIGGRSNGNALMWVGHVPLLDVAELSLGAIGLYHALFSGRSPRTVLMVGAVVVSLVLIALGGAVSFAILVPLVYLFVASGLDHLLSQWFGVFPRNPIARFIGVGLVCVMLFFSVFYQVRSYFVAWAHAPAMRQVFDHEQ